MKLYETNLGTNHIIFGFPWLKEFNPNIDWKQGQIKMFPIKAWELNHTTITTEWAQQQKVQNRGIPEKYLRHAKVFDEKEAQR